MYSFLACFSGFRLEDDIVDNCLQSVPGYLLEREMVVMREVRSKR